ncbi:MAG: major facilitator superfamily 1 [Candidatus Solibacter sp.]|nr:major facilitator superfamily 1 [Candidatus Solibacter sp.]
MISPALAPSKTRTAAVVFAGFCAFVTLFAPQPLLPLLAREFRVTPGAISLVVTASTLAVALAAPFAGVVADRFGRKRVIVPAAFLLAVPTLMAATAGSYGQLLFWRFLQGIFTPGIFAVVIAYINEEWEAGAGAATAAYVTGTVLGGFSGRALAAMVASHANWRWAFVALGTLNLLGAIAIRAWLPAGHRFKRTRAGGSPRAAMLRHLRNPRLVATYVVGFCVMFSLLGTFTYVNFYLAAPPFNLSTAALGLLFVVYLVGAVVTPVAGRAIDRLGHRFALVVAFTGGATGVCLTLVHSLPVVMVGLTLACTGVFIANSAGSSYVGSAATESRASAVGLYVTFYYVGGSGGSAIPGFFWTHGGWPACVALIVGVQLLTITLALIFWKPLPKSNMLTAAIEEG